MASLPPWVSYRYIKAAALSRTGVAGKPGTNAHSKDDVLRYQKGLAEVVGLDYSSGPGVYGPRTKAATKKFQERQGWSGSGADGIVGPLTLKRLADQSGEFRARGFVEPKGSSIPGNVRSPVPGYRVNYPFGVRNSRYSAGFHTGNDYAAPRGTSVVAVTDGVIAWSNNRGGAYGRWICLRADNGRDYVYCHLSVRDVRTGQRVRAGQHLGKVGTTGNSTGPHLHFEDRSRGGGYGQVRRPRW